MRNKIWRSIHRKCSIKIGVLKLQTTKQPKPNNQKKPDNQKCLMFLRNIEVEYWLEIGCKVLGKIRLLIVRSSHQRCSVRKGVLRNFAKFTGGHLCQNLFLIKRRPLLTRRIWHRYFPVNFAKFLRTPFLQNTSGRLLLDC